MLIFLREELGYLKASYVSASLVSGHHSTVVGKKVRPYSGGQKQGGNYRFMMGNSGWDKRAHTHSSIRSKITIYLYGFQTRYDHSVIKAQKSRFSLAKLAISSSFIYPLL